RRVVLHGVHLLCLDVHADRVAVLRRVPLGVAAPHHVDLGPLFLQPIVGNPEFHLLVQVLRENGHALARELHRSSFVRQQIKLRRLTGYTGRGTAPTRRAAARRETAWARGSQRDCTTPSALATTASMRSGSAGFCA